MSSNPNLTSPPSRPKNGYSRDDVMRIVSEYKNKRIKLISEAVKLSGIEKGQMGDVVSPKNKERGANVS